MPRLESAGFFAIRSPLLPFDTLTSWTGLDRQALRETYRRLLEQPAVREALFLASPDLDASLAHWHRDPESEKGQATERALTRYLTRMAARPTPFGLCASTAVGTCGTRTMLPVARAEACGRHTRLDMDYLVLLVERLEADPVLRDVLRYTPNSTLYRSADGLRYVETRLRGKTRSHHLVALERSDALDATLARARHGATRAGLLAALAEFDLTTEDAEAFVADLIESQVVVSHLACPLTGPEPHGVLERELRALPGGTPAADVLASALRALEAIDAAPPGSAPDAYGALARRLEALPAPVDPARLFQADLIRPPGGTIGPDVVADLARGALLLQRLHPPDDSADLDRFRDAFAERYGERAVPLADALDTDTGVGAALQPGDRGASSLLRGMETPSPERQPVGWGRREQWLLDRVGRALLAHEQAIDLSPADIDRLAPASTPPLPDAVAVMATLVADRASSPGRERVRVLLHGLSGPSGATLLGRFCHADDDLHAHVARHLRDEEARDPEAIYAEIVHLPEGRLGNILLRPLLRTHEIAWLGRSGAHPDRQIALDDLTLALVDGRFVLRSMRLGRRIVPRLTSAHDFRHSSVGVYRFLCLLPFDGRADHCAWTWGPLRHLPFLPRVTAGNLVLSRATWNLTASDLLRLRGTTADARPGAVQAWRQARALPRWVVLADHDNLLPIDLDNPLAVDSLLHLLRSRDAATLTELYPGPDELIAHGPEGAYAHELIVPFIVHHAAPEARASAAATASAAAAPVVRTHAPGSAWVFAKVYSGVGLADRLLLEQLAPLSQVLASDGRIDRWFFVRYQDPDAHLRWRLRVRAGTSPHEVQRLVAEALRPVIDQGLVRRLAFDTYERELERYGGADGLELAEDWFSHDSDAVVSILEALGDSDDGGELRWRVGLLGADALLADLGLDVQARHAVVSRACDGWGRTLHADAAFRAQVATRLRPLHRELTALLTSGVDQDSALGRAVEPLRVRSERSRAGMLRVQELEKAGVLGRPVDVLAESYVHMFMNRLFGSEQNLHELVLYDFLRVLYGSQLARRSPV